mgnify:CR=1 FL=1
MDNTDNISDERKRYIEIVMRQTEYTYEEANQMLEEENNDYIKVIKRAVRKSFLKNDKSVNEKNVEVGVESINQSIYKNIRRMMDGV